MEHEVIVYTTPTCPWCQMVKRYLEARGIPYTEVDVSQNYQAALEMVRKSGQTGVPVVEIDGEIVVGFDRERIDQLLGLA
ncbi:MAG: glutaredoxin domain-containing protein [Candidatus Bipolaricaulaceae bacterium]|nr:glutathione S-transferase N-terminal domain-containing protein [Candidatus Bipolaricaulota bacterium]MCX7844454.1 glutathione S-transferase N-terminal domain-containing protein [Candidatus Bipolaricaulota bacterium]MDW8152154.1 glutaredoxin domain-containing protein [Candidatus Bipolaricaulota bacterium]